MTNPTATFQNGNREVTATITGSAEWTSGDKSRVYFDLAFDGKRAPIRKLYQVVSGGTADHKVEHDGKVYGYEYGIDADSKTKRREVDEAVAALVAQI